jgi:nicotinamide-nucleotide amidase
VDAALIAIGSELFHAGTRDTNSEWLAGRLEALGALVRCRATVDDSVERIGALVAALFGTVDLLVLTGGLGPTEDDRTREAIARALDAPLVRDPDRLALLEKRFRSKGYRWSEAQARQADRPEGSRWIENAVGSAPGIEVERAGAVLFALPGVPAEMTEMFDSGVAPRLRPGSPPPRRILKVAGRAESFVDELLRDLYGTPGLEATILAKPSGIELRLRASADRPDAAAAILAGAESEMRRRLGADLFGADDATLPSVVGALLLERGETVATAESCTAGLLAAALTDVPGSSAWFRGGVVVYANDLKTSLLGVPEAMLLEHGAVSAPVAAAMARSARERASATHGIGVTGIAGPSGASEAKPVGLVHLAVSGPRGEGLSRHVFSGGRSHVRERAVYAALDLLRRRLASP